MPSCALCGSSTGEGGGDICLYHPTTSEAANWAAWNRVMCDYFHRGIQPERLSESERDDPPPPAPEDCF